MQLLIACDQLKVIATAQGVDLDDIALPHHHGEISPRPSCSLLSLDCARLTTACVFLIKASKSSKRKFRNLAFHFTLYWIRGTLHKFCSGPDFSPISG